MDNRRPGSRTGYYLVQAHILAQYRNESEYGKLVSDENGKPIANPQSQYHGDKDMYATFRDRDPRLYHTVIPPYKVTAGKGDN